MTEIDRLLRLHRLLEVTGLSKPTLYRMMARGEFPGSVRLGARSVAWRSSEVAQWIADRTRTAQGGGR